jgi:hypothetical protein
MDERDQKGLRKAIGYDDENKYLRKEVRIIDDGKQMTIRIPKKFVTLAKVDPKNTFFEFTAFPEMVNGKKRFIMKAELVRTK